MYRKNRIICRNFERVELFLGSFAFSWEQRKLGEVSDSYSGGTPTVGVKEYYDGQIPFIRSAEINSRITELFLTEDGLKNSSARLVEPGDTLYALYGATSGEVGRARLKGAINQAILAIKPHKGYDSEYISQWLRRSKHRIIETYLQGGQGNLSGAIVKELSVDFPSLKEQQAIGAYFKYLDNLITLHQRKVHINTKRPMRLSENERSIKTISWEQRKLVNEVSSVDTGKSKFTSHESGKYEILGSTSVIGYDNSYDYEGDFLLTARVGANAGELYRHSGKVKISDNTVFIQGSQLDFIYYALLNFDIKRLSFGTGQPLVKASELKEQIISMPTSKIERDCIGKYFCQLDHLITLHQRKSPSRKNWRCVMIKETRGIDLFHEYYAKWITVYKKGAIRKVTMDKYLMTQKWLEKLIPDLRICDMNRIAYQQLLNDYAEHHERQTTMDFHHQLKGAILDAVDEGLIDRDPTRKAIIKGRTPMSKKVKYLNQFELHTLLTSLELKNEVNWDYFILLVAKTGMRFSEALALTPKDFDFSHQTLSINKTWDYKGKGGFQPTKNKSSIRKIQIDWQTVIQFSELVKGFPKDQPIFVKSNVYNSTVNDILGRYCERSNIPVISIHGLRHTHASLLLFAGVSIASVARRLGHSSMTTTQKTYLHIIQELENKDIDLVMRSLSGLS